MFSCCGCQPQELHCGTREPEGAACKRACTGQAVSRSRTESQSPAENGKGERGRQQACLGLSFNLTLLQGSTSLARLGGPVRIAPGTGRLCRGGVSWGLRPQRIYSPGVENQGSLEERSTCTAFFLQPRSELILSYSAFLENSRNLHCKSKIFLMACFVCAFYGGLRVC